MDFLNTNDTPISTIPPQTTPEGLQPVIDKSDTPRTDFVDDHHDYDQLRVHAETLEKELTKVWAIVRYILP